MDLAYDLSVKRVHYCAVHILAVTREFSSVDENSISSFRSKKVAVVWPRALWNKQNLSLCFSRTSLSLARGVRSQPRFASWQRFLRSRRWARGTCCTIVYELGPPRSPDASRDAFYHRRVDGFLLRGSLQVSSSPSVDPLWGFLRKSSQPLTSSKSRSQH